MASKSQRRAATSQIGDDLEEGLRILDKKLQQLKLDYEQYFMGGRPREPSMPRQEIQKQVNILSQTPIQNTALRFRFNSISSRFMSYKRQWDTVLRQIEAGTYQRHVFKASLKERSRSGAEEKRVAADRKAASGSGGGKLFSAYVEAARSCGQDTSGLSQAKLAAVVQKQEAAIRQKFGCDRVQFKVVVQQGKVKLKASPVK